jgi:hypothetical protein
LIDLTEEPISKANVERLTTLLIGPDMELLKQVIRHKIAKAGVAAINAGNDCQFFPDKMKAVEASLRNADEFRACLKVIDSLEEKDFTKVKLAC